MRMRRSSLVPGTRLARKRSTAWATCAEKGGGARRKFLGGRDTSAQQKAKMDTSHSDQLHRLADTTYRVRKKGYRDC